MARFDNEDLDFYIIIKMKMDITKKIETEGLMESTKKLLAFDLIPFNASVSKIRLHKRDVAGMPGDEAVLLQSEKGKNILLSIALEPNTIVSEQFYLSAAMALSARNFF